MIRSTALFLLVLSSACTNKPDPADDSSTTDDSVAMSPVFPSGTSSWTGTAEISGATLNGTAELTRTAGTVEGTVSLDFNGSNLSFTLLGTIDDQSGQLAMLPVAWVGADPGLGMVGLTAVYDPAANTLTGLVRDVQSWDFPTVDGGPLSFSTTTPAELVESSTLTTPPVLGETPMNYSGTFQCSTDVRPVRGSLSRGSDGQVEGTISWDEADGSYVGVFPVVGAEDAATGNLTLLPQPWLEEVSETRNYKNFFVHGTVTPEGYTGTLSQDVGMVCFADQFQVLFD